MTQMAPLFSTIIELENIKIASLLINKKLLLYPNFYSLLKQITKTLYYRSLPGRRTDITFSFVINNWKLIFGLLKRRRATTLREKMESF